MLTTQASQAIRDNVVTDVNANLVAPQAPPKATLSPEAAILFDKSIVARPLMVPEVCSIRVKNLEYRYRWVNKSGRNGFMYTMRRNQGFINATSDDVELLGGDAVCTNGEITAGDVILMKIRADLYDAAMKYNMQKAFTLQRTRGMFLQNASSDVMSDDVAQKVSIAQESFGKGAEPSKRSAPAFIPTDPEALVNGSKSSLEAAREQTKEIRDKIAADKAAKAAKAAEE